jgi:hypothetical protein
VGPRADLDGQGEANISYHTGLRNPDNLARSKSLYQLRPTGPQTVVIRVEIKNPDYRQCVVNLQSDRPLCTLSVSLSSATY